MKGIDVSDCQGKIDWNQVKNAGVEFVILRTTRHSGNPDTYLATNIKNLIEFDIPFDFYKYSYAVTVDQAAAEARKVVEVLKGYGVAPEPETIIYMDIEEKSQFALSSRSLTDIVNAFKKVIDAAGYGFGLYMSKSPFDCGEVITSEIIDWTWIARYYKGNREFDFKDDPDESYKPGNINEKLLGWQYSSRGIVPGIKGYVDLDIYYGYIKHSTVYPEYYQSPEFTLIDALNKIGVDSSYNNRKKIALKNDIINYKGSKEQNMEILSLLMQGRLKK